MSWYNPFTWFGYTNPENNEYTEVNLDGSGATKSGAVVSARNALCLPVVWACIRLISGTVSTLPLKLFEEVDGKKVAVKGSKSFLLKKPNANMTMSVFLESVLISLLLNGNHYSLIERNNSGKIIAIIPIDCSTVRPNFQTGQLLYEVITQDGERTLISPENMLHYKIFSADGIVGLSFVEYMRETLGLLQTARDYSAYHMANGGFTGGWVVYDTFLTKDQRDAVKERFKTVKQSGVKDVSKIVVLEGGAKFQSRNMSQKDAQFLEGQSFTVVDLCGALGVPPQMIGRTEKSTSYGTGFETQTMGFLTYGLRYYLVRIEEETNEKIYKEQNYKCEFMLQGLLRGDSNSRSTFYTSALGGSGGSGYMTINEVRKLENLPPVADGDSITKWEQNNAENNSTV